MRHAMLLTLLLGALYLLPSAPDAAIPRALAGVEGKVLLVDFWASWCTPCRRSFPWMNEMHEKYREQGLTIVAVNVDRERGAAEEFLRETPARFQLHYDPDGELAEEFGVEAMPTSYLLDSAGNVLARHLGFKLAKAPEYEALIREALRGEEVDR